MNINYGERLLALRFLQNCSQALAIGTRARAVIFVCALFLNLKNVSKLKLSILQFWILEGLRHNPCLSARGEKSYRRNGDSSVARALMELGPPWIQVGSREGLQLQGRGNSFLVYKLYAKVTPPQHQTVFEPVPLALLQPTLFQSAIK